MRVSDLNKLLDSKIEIHDFTSSMVDEVENYKRLMTERGSSINLVLNEDETIKLNRSKFKTLLQFVIADRLSNIHLSYICDCLTLVEDLETDEQTKELLFQFADPEMNRGYVQKEELVRIVLQLE